MGFVWSPLESSKESLWEAPVAKVMAFGGGGGGYRHEHNSWAIGVLSEGQGRPPRGNSFRWFFRKDRREFLSFRLEVWVKFSVGCLGYLLGDGDFTLPKLTSLLIERLVSLWTWLMFRTQYVGFRESDIPPGRRVGWLFPRTLRPLINRNG